MPLTRPADVVRYKAPEADLRLRYAKTFWSCFGISALALMALVVLFPNLDADAYDKTEKVIIQIENIPETRQERRPPPPPRPVVPIASQSDDIPDDATIMETELDFGLDDLPPPPPLADLQGVELEEEEEEIVEIWRVEKQPVPVKDPQPIYPEIARKAGITGTVTVQVLVDKTGKVEAVQILKGNEVFHEAVKKAAWQWTFTPAIQNDKPVKVWVALPFRFQLN
ncbi:MAG TPA: energy transducer TonB [Candidatus Latescibacteria bacterium]|jgi:protein TonB|nr:energy transducer TonB [Candidatus Latescibacterota bacterium]|tara:strand:+ start:2585 stop:3259 length:675 start_codon:yes stop_codon:yes gene_type:complete